MEDAGQMQEEVWTQLHHAVTEILAQYGTKNAFGEGDYWINDDNYGWARIHGWNPESEFVSPGNSP